MLRAAIVSFTVPTVRSTLEEVLDQVAEGDRVLRLNQWGGVKLVVRLKHMQLVFQYVEGKLKEMWALERILGHVAHFGHSTGYVTGDDSDAMFKELDRPFLELGSKYTGRVGICQSKVVVFPKESEFQWS